MNPPKTVWLVWQNEEGCDDCSCPYPDSLEGVYLSQDTAIAKAKTLWGGRVAQETLKP